MTLHTFKDDSKDIIEFFDEIADSVWLIIDTELIIPIPKFFFQPFLSIFGSLSPQTASFFQSNWNKSQDLQDFKKTLPMNKISSKHFANSPLFNYPQSNFPTGTIDQTPTLIVYTNRVSILHLK